VSFPDQVGWFLGNVTESKRADKPEWEGSSSIFSASSSLSPSSPTRPRLTKSAPAGVFFGINDINLQTAWGYPIVDVLEPTFEAYDQSISRLYDAGGASPLLSLTALETCSSRASS